MIAYKTYGDGLDADVFVRFANQVWPGSYNVYHVADALKRQLILPRGMVKNLWAA